MKHLLSHMSLPWLVIWLVMIGVCHSAAAYHFYYLEQWGTFYYEGNMMWQLLHRLPLVVADFLVQFFYYGAGPVIFASLMTLVAWAQNKMMETRFPYLGCITAMTMLLTLTANVACLLAGSVCFTLAMLLMVVLFRCHKILKVVAVFLLFWLVRKEYLVRDGQELPAIAYLPWATAAILLVVQFLVKKLDAWAQAQTKKQKAFGWVAQGILVVGVSVALFANLYQAQEEYMKKIYYFVHHQQWDEIINRSYSRGSKDNVTFQLCRNMALAEKGQLGEKFLMYEQKGMASVVTSDMSTLQGAALLADVYYAMGYVNMAQLCAFEAQECMDNKSPYLWQRLVDTNIENGAYAVAEKYIKKLEHTLAYRAWAHERRRFLYNDRAVQKDPVLGVKRKCIFKDDCFIGNGGFDNDLARIVEACPEHRASLEYLGAMYIVSNQRGKFIELIEKYQGTKAMPRIPASFDKALKTFKLQETYSINPSNDFVE